MKQGIEAVYKWAENEEKKRKAEFELFVICNNFIFIYFMHLNNSPVPCR